MEVEEKGLKHYDLEGLKKKRTTQLRSEFTINRKKAHPKHGVPGGDARGKNTESNRGKNTGLNPHPQPTKKKKKKIKRRRREAKVTLRELYSHSMKACGTRTREKGENYHEENDFRKKQEAHKGRNSI